MPEVRKGRMLDYLAKHPIVKWILFHLVVVDILAVAALCIVEIIVPHQPVRYQSSFVVPSRGGTVSVPITLQSGQKLDGQFYVAENAPVEFAIRGPGGVTVYGPTSVIGTTFGAGIDQGGAYTLVWRNCESCPERTVTVEALLH